MDAASIQRRASVLEVIAYTIVMRRFAVRMLLASLVFAFALAPLSAKQRNVVVIHSYHQGFVWTDRIQEGIAQALARFGPEIDIHTEYLDAKRFPLSGQYRAAAAEAFRLKFAKARPDVVVVSDNAALSFVVENRETVFPSVPVVFCGINNFVPALLGGKDGFTGTSEDPDIAGTINTALEITGATSLVLITDSTDTGSRNRAAAVGALRDLLAGAVTFYALDGNEYDLEEVCEALKGLDSKWVVLFLDFFEDKRKEYLAIDSVLPAICAASPVPVFTHVDLYFGIGPVGGILNRGIDQGRTAGELAARILDGEPVDSIPIIPVSSPVPVFDFRALERHGLSEKALPPGSRIFYRPVSVWNAYRPYILTGAAVFALLSAAVAGLSITVAAKRRAELALLKSREQLRSIYDGMSDAVFIHDPADGSILDVNETAVAYYGYTLEELRNMRVSQLSEDASDQSQEAALSLIRRAGAGENLRFQWRARRRDGVVFTSDVAMRRAVAAGREVVIVSGRDVSERERAKAELERALREKETLLAEIHHRVKNNFQIISSLLDLQLMEAQARCGDDDLEIEALREPRDRIHAMALVHELLYRAGNYDSIDLDDYLRELSSYLSTAYNAAPRGIACDIEAASVALEIGRAVPCGLAVNELLVNAYKYAFADKAGGRIVVRASVAGSRLSLSVADDGVGLPADIVSGERRGGLGLTLVQGLVQQLGGTMDFSPGLDGRGTAVRLEFGLAGVPAGSPPGSRDAPSRPTP